MANKTTRPQIVRAFVVQGTLCRTILEYGPHDIEITLDVMDKNVKPTLTIDGRAFTPSMLNSYGWITSQSLSGSTLDEMLSQSREALSHVWIAARDLN